MARSGATRKARPSCSSGCSGALAKARFALCPTSTNAESARWSAIKRTRSAPRNCSSLPPGNSWS
eukprot:4252885-Alexandrium_andersonii.AAC.1